MMGRPQHSPQGLHSAPQWRRRRAYSNDMPSHKPRYVKCDHSIATGNTVSDSTQSSYTRTAIFLHWITAILVAALFGIGWYMVELPKGPDRGATFALHKSIGITVFILTALRFAWRWIHRPPPLPSSIKPWQRLVARATHLTFYVLLTAQPLSGYLSSSFSGYRTSYFGIPLPDWGRSDPALNEFFTEIHVLCSVALLSLIIVHVAGAISHALRDGEGVFRRMWRW